MKIQDVKNLTLGVNELSVDQVSSFLRTYNVNVGKVTRVDISVEKFIILSLTVLVTRDRKRINVKERNFIVKLDDMMMRYADFDVAVEAAFKMEEIYYQERL